MQIGSDNLWQGALGAFRAGNHPAAEANCRRLIQRDPGAPMAYWLLAKIATARARWREAEDWATAAATRLDAADWRERLLVCRQLLESGDSGLAHAGVQPLLGQDLPIEAQAEVVLLCSQLDDFTAALMGAERIRRRGYADDFESETCGIVFGFLGQLESAEEAFEHSIAVRPENCRAHWNCAQFGSAGRAAHRVARVRSLLSSPGLSPVDQVQLRYALFQDLDALDLRDDAWTELAIGAALQRQLLRYEPAAEARAFAQRREEYQRATRPIALGEGGGAVPVFVLGQPRTGTTLVERQLAAEPSLARCGELPDFPLQRRWVRDGREAGSGIDYALLGRRYLEKTTWRWRGKRFFTDKLPINAVNCGDILLALPEARIVHMQRHPMDCAFSNLKVLFREGGLPHSYQFEDLAAHYRNLDALMKHWREVADGRVLSVRYEDLASNPEPTLRRIRSHVGVESSPVQAGGDGGAPETTASTRQVRQPLDTRYVGGWKRYREQLRPLEALLAREIAEYEGG